MVALLSGHTWTAIVGRYPRVALLGWRYSGGATRMALLGCMLQVVRRVDPGTFADVTGSSAAP